MFGPDVVCYRRHTSTVFIDPKTTIATMRQHAKQYFKNKRPRETHTVHRGHLITTCIEDFTGAPNTLMVSVCGFDVKNMELFPLSAKVNSVAEAEEFIDVKMDNPDCEPPVIAVERVQETLHLGIDIRSCRNSDGKIESFDFLQISTVEGVDVRPGNTAGNTLESVLLGLIEKHLK